MKVSLEGCHRVSGLFSVFRTQLAIRLIRCSATGPANVGIPSWPCRIASSNSATCWARRCKVRLQQAYALEPQTTRWAP